MTNKQIKTRSKDRDATEERLLLAAEQIFSKFGFKGATTRMIAKKADINLALINRYFDGKYGLFLKVLENKSQRMHYTDLPYPIQDNVTDECMSFALYRFDTMLDDVQFFKIVIAQFLTDPKFLKKFQESLLNFEAFPDFEKRIQSFIDRKKITPELSVRKFFEAIDTQVCAHLLFKIIIQGDSAGSARESLREFIHTYCKGLEI